MCNAGCANNCFYAPATCRLAGAIRRNIRNKQGFVI
jgi:hypothetical protein